MTAGPAPTGIAAAPAPSGVPGGTGVPGDVDVDLARPEPLRLAAPEPDRALEGDVVVVGSGVAGLTAALRCAAAGLRTVVVTKARLDDGSTRWAQGGVAAALGEGDSPAQHLADTLAAGAGLCDEEAVRTLVTEGPAAVRRLITTGAVFDTVPGSDRIALTREGGHRRRRIAHAGGDATGAEISRALVTAVRKAAAEQTAGGPLVRTLEHALVLDLLVDADGRAAGVTLYLGDEDRPDAGGRVGAVHAPAVVLATGGLGQVFAATTNPAVSTGDGLALALRAGAEVSDLEFVQFHPTVLWLGPDSRGQQPLVSEAVRGEGAHLVDGDGVRFMVGEHELAELAPRDVVAKGIMRRMRAQGAAHMYLDARHFGARMWEQRFPTILAACRAHGIDPVSGLIPVAPAAHYASGGVRTDRHGRTTVPGLYACGEVACTGVHGANRLASNSLLEGLVFAERIAEAIAGEPRPRGAGRPAAAPAGHTVPLVPASARGTIQQIMTHGAGVLRSADSLASAAAALDALPTGGGAAPGPAAWEATNLRLVARALVAAALHRTETRGCHWREDHPDPDDATWRRHLLLTLRPGTPSGPGRPGAGTRGADAALAIRTTDGTALPAVASPGPRQRPR